MIGTPRWPSAATSARCWRWACCCTYQVTRNWLVYAGAHLDVRLQAMFLARDLARAHDETTSLASAAFALARTTKPPY